MKTWWLDGMTWIVLLSLSVACQPVNQEKEGDRLLAKVHSKTLYLSELDGMFPEGTTSEDSAATIDAYVARWLREAVILHEAERNIPSDLNIDKLVRDYRASLIRHNYEKILIDQRLDSTITKSELIEFYEKNKEQYQLETPIIRCYFIKVPVTVSNLNELRRLWNSTAKDDFDDLVSYSNQFAEAHILDDSTWHKVENIAAELPPGTLTADNVGAKKDFSQRDNKFQYYLKVFEIKKQKDIAPLSFIEEQARKFILHRRKIKLLEDIKDDMYELEMQRKNIQVFTD